MSVKYYRRNDFYINLFNNTVDILKFSVEQDRPNYEGFCQVICHGKNILDWPCKLLKNVKYYIGYLRTPMKTASHCTTLPFKIDGQTRSQKLLEILGDEPLDNNNVVFFQFLERHY